MSLIGKKVLITGHNGQIGKALCRALSEAEITGVDLSVHKNSHLANIESIDVTKKGQIRKLISKLQPDWVFHLPAIMSGDAERGPIMAKNTLKLNVDSFTYMLELARIYKFRLFSPSTIAAFGPDSPKIAPDVAIRDPKFLYGITKYYNEMLGDYFNRRYGVDFRSIRLPGVIDSNASTSLGTTDFAIDMLQSVSKGKYDCYLREDTMLPMVHIDDCIEGIVKLMTAPKDKLTRSVYNIQSFSLSPKILGQEIERQTGKLFRINCNPDPRQAIADSWPEILDDINARRDWAWSPQRDLRKTVREILTRFHTVKK